MTANAQGPRSNEAAAALPLPYDSAPPARESIPDGHTVYYDSMGRRMVMPTLRDQRDANVSDAPSAHGSNQAPNATYAGQGRDHTPVPVTSSPDRAVSAAAALALPYNTGPPPVDAIPPGHTVHYDDMGRRMVMPPFIQGPPPIQQ